MPDPVDYDALAKQAGAISSAPPAVDYGALAKQAGAISSTPAAPRSAVAPGSTDDDIIQAFGYDPKLIKSSAIYQRRLKDNGSGLAYMLQDPNEDSLERRLVNSKLGDVAKGALDVVTGAGQLLTHGLNALHLTSDADTAYSDLTRKVFDADYATNIRHGQESGAAKMLGAMAVPLPGGSLIKGEGIASTLLRGALDGATAGALQPTDEQTARNFATAKLTQAAEGAAAGTVLGGALHAAGAGVKKVVPFIRGDAHIPAAHQQVLDQAAQHGVRDMTYGDVTGDPNAQNAESLLEKIPLVGLKGVRERQQADVKAAADAVASKLQGSLASTPFADLQDVAQAAKGQGEGAQKAQDLLDLLHGAGNDPDLVAQASMGLQNFRTSKTASDLYDRVQQIADEKAPNPVEVDNTLAALTRNISELKGAKMETPEGNRMIALFTNLKKNLKAGVDVHAFDQAQAAANAQGSLPLSSGAPGGGGTPAPVAGAPGGAPGASPEATPGPGVGPSNGNATAIRVPGEQTAYPAKYVLRELADLQASHNGQTFQPNPKFGAKNDRNYANPVNQGKVIQGSGPEFDPAYHVTDNPDATNGPLIIDSDNNVLGGNGRKMMLDRVYGANGKGAAAYRAALASKAEQFGLDPAAIAGMKQPVLGREIPDEALAGPGAKAKAITDFNKKGTAALTPSEQAIADSRGVSQGTLDHIAGALEQKGPDATLGNVLQGQGGVDVLNKLIGDGVVSPQERAAFATQDALTDAGRRRISQLLLGRFFRDPAQLDSIPASIRNKVERIAAPLARVDGAPGGWDLTPHVQDALDLLDSANAHGEPDVDAHLQQIGLFGDQQFSPQSVAIAKQLQVGHVKSLADQVAQYAGDAQHAAAGADMFGNNPKPAQSFVDAFGGDVSKMEGAVPPTPEGLAARRAARDAFLQQQAAAASPAQAEAPQRPDGTPNSYAAIRQLRQDIGSQISQFHQGSNAVIGEKGVGYLQRVKEAVERDLSGFVEKSGVPELGEAAKRADTYYRSDRVPFKDRMIANAVKTSEPDQIFSKFLQQGKGDRAQKFYDALDDKGRAAVRVGLVQQAITKATDESSGFFSPKKFVSALDKQQAAAGVFFRGKDAWELNGFKNLLAHTTRAGQYADNSHNGAGLLLGLGLERVLAHPVMAIKGAALSGAARVMLATPQGRNFLLSASSLPVGSPALDRLAARISTSLQGAGARQAVSSLAPRQTGSPGTAELQ